MGMRITKKDDGSLNVETWGGTDSRTAQAIHMHSSYVGQSMDHHGSDVWEDPNDCAGYGSLKVDDNSTTNLHYKKK